MDLPHGARLQVGAAPHVTWADLPLSRTWASGPDARSPGPWGLLSLSGTLSFAACYASLFWPDLIVFDDQIYLRERYSRINHREWLDQNLTLEQVQRVINHTHLHDLFFNDPHRDSVDPAVVDYIGTALAACWQAGIASRLPGRPISVLYEPGPDGDGMDMPSITLWQHARLP